MRGIGARKRGSARFLGIVAVAATASLVLGGCVPGDTQLTPQAGDRTLYLGPLPQPMELAGAGGAPSNVLPAAPTPPEDMTDEAAVDAYLKALDDYVKALEESGIDLETGEGIEDLTSGMVAYSEGLAEVAKAAAQGGEKAVAAWQTLYVSAGIAVTGASGALVDVNGRTGFGHPVADAELRMWAVPSPGVGLPLTDLAALVAGIYGADEGQLVDLIYESLLSPSDVEFGMTFNQFQPMAFSTEWGIRPAGEVMLTLDQVNLALRRLAAEISVHFGGDPDSAASGGTRSPQASVLTVPAGAVGLSRAAGPRPCEITEPWAKGAVKGANMSFDRFVFSTTLDLLENIPGAEKWTSRLKGGLGAGSAVLAVLSVLAKAKSLRATMSLSNAPLVRTKTNQPGEVRDLKVKMHFDKELWEDMRRCASLFLGAAGVDASPGDASGGGLKLDIHSEEQGRMLVGDGTGGSAEAVTRATTDANGEATFTLSGAPYREKIPETASPDEFPVGVRVDSNLQESDFWADMTSLATQVVSAGIGTLLTAALDTIQRMKVLSFSSDVPFRDWYLDAEFDVTLTGSVNGRSASHHTYRLYSECGGGSLVTSSSTDATGSLETQDAVRVYAKLVSDPDSYHGPQVVLFAEPETGEFPWQIGRNGVLQFPMQADFRVDKQYTDPGVAPLPTPADGGIMGCGDGTGDGETTAMDCGTRDFEAGLEVNRKGASFVVTGAPFVERPWSHCGGGTQPREGLVPPNLADCKSMSAGGGLVPPIDDVFDAKKSKLEVSGSLTCSENREGSLMDYRFDWTLTFCRIVEAKPAC